MKKRDLEAGFWQQEGRSAVNTWSKQQQGEVSSTLGIQQRPISAAGNMKGGKPAIPCKRKNDYRKLGFGRKNNENVHKDCQ